MTEVVVFALTVQSFFDAALRGNRLHTQVCVCEQSMHIRMRSYCCAHSACFTHKYLSKPHCENVWDPVLLCLCNVFVSIWVSVCVYTRASVYIN